MHKLKILLLIFVYLMFFCFNFYVFQYICFFDIDDLNSTLDPYPLIAEENGRYVFNIISRIFCLHIPNLFGIHVQDSLSTLGLTIYSLILLLLFSVVSSFSLIKRKNYFIYFTLFIFSEFVFLYNYAFHNGYFYSSMVTFQYGYVFATAITLGFLLYIYNYIITGRLPRYKYLLGLCLLGFSAGNSTQFMCYTTAIVLFLLIFSYLIKRKLKIKKLKFLIKQKRIFYPVCSFFLGLTLMVTCPGFWAEVSWRHAESFQQIKDIFIPFFKEYYDVIILGYIKYYILILLLLFIILIDGFLKRKIGKYFYLCTTILFPIVGGLFYFATLILAGPTFPDYTIYYWIYEPFYHFCFLMILCSIISLIVGILLNNINNKRIKCFSFVMISIYCFISICNVNTFYKDEIETYINQLKDYKKNVYKNEKMMLYYSYKNIDKIKLIENIHIPNPRYMKRIYGLSFDEQLIYTNEQDAINFYEENGGVFSPQELIHLNFQKLKDKNFVLNNQEEKNE